MDERAMKSFALINVASKFVGVTENGDNCGKEVEMFQKAVDGKAQKESWCACMVQYCLLKTCTDYKWSPSLYKSEHCLTIWNKTDQSCRLSLPECGAVVIWGHYANGKPTGTGHCGICLSGANDDGIFETVEGNTGPGKAINREGDGVYKKQRHLVGSDTMRVMGFLWPFVETAAPTSTPDDGATTPNYVEQRETGIIDLIADLFKPGE